MILRAQLAPAPTVSSTGTSCDSPYALDLELVIPAFNEERRLPATLATMGRSLDALPLRCGITIVDNGSTDATAEIARDWSGPVPVTVIGCSRQGKGAAVRRGMVTTRARWVGFCDADLATSVDALDAVVAELHAGAPIVIGSRRLAQAQLLVPHGPVRRAGSSGFRTLVRRLVPGVTDTQCGFKFFQGEVARTLFAACRCDGFAFDVEVLARATRLGHSVVEIPVEWTAQPGSTFSVLRHGHHAARELLHIRSLLRSVPTPELVVRPAEPSRRAA